MEMDENCDGVYSCSSNVAGNADKHYKFSNKEKQMMNRRLFDTIRAKENKESIQMNDNKRGERKTTAKKR